ncbi:hypothetical protein QD47_21665 [Paenibacillus terrae]|uniref:Tn3 transposase DDE domain-containing protein n=1 Tax=Paenibacillus terrae TaxID=159743 RepID=A0A0D7X0S4_9BACL|nr:hypothetical protein QD47_21665 [Paenibacillus terrae]
MGKLGSYARQNSLATALREMGRIEKTIFIMDYLSSEALRRKIHRGLNKGEAINALARAIFFGKHGELRERALKDQLQRASALNILINAISVWNTVYLTQATEFRKSSKQLNEELLKHISPLGWEHINILGEYKIDIKQIASLKGLALSNNCQMKNKNKMTRMTFCNAFTRDMSKTMGLLESCTDEEIKTSRIFLSVRIFRLV